MNERVPLSYLLVEHKDEKPPVEPGVPFAAFRGEDLCIVTAVLERTAICSSPTDKYERLAVKHQDVLVDPAMIEWKAVANGRPTKLDGTPVAWGRRGKLTEEERRVARDKGDQKVRENQAQVARALAAEREQDAKLRSKELKDLSDRATPPIIAKQHAEASALKQDDIGGGNSTTNVALLARSSTAEPPVKKSLKKLGDRETLKLKRCPRCGVEKPRSAYPAGQGNHACIGCPGASEKPEAQVSPVGTCVTCGARGRLNPQGICTRHGPRAKKGEKATHKMDAKVTILPEESALKNEAPAPARTIKRPPRHRTRPEGCIRKCRPFRDDVYHAPGCPHRVEQLEKFNRKAPPTSGCRACEAPGRGIRHAVGCPHRRGPLSNAEMVALAAGTLRTVEPTTTEQSALAVVPATQELAPIPVIAGMPTRSDWLALLTHLRVMKAENDVLKADLRQLFNDLKEVVDA